MQVLFTGFAITPYFRDFLNRLQSQGEIKVANVRPSGQNRHLGAGVHQDFSKIAFNDFELTEVRIAPRRLLNASDLEIAPGLNSFEGLDTLIRELQPDVIVVNVNYHAAFCFDPEVKSAVKAINAKLVFHSIPFQLPTFQEAVASMDFSNELQLRSLPEIPRRLASGLRLNKLYFALVRRRAMLRRVSFQKTVFNAADAHAVYHEGGRLVYGSYGVQSARIHVVRNSPNTELLLASAARYPSVDNGCRLIHVGRLVEWKRVDMLISSLATLRSNGFPDTDLMIIGYGPCEEALKKLTQNLKLDDAVHFRGGVYDPDELAQEFSKASIYVLAGMGGLSINEAMCFGVPIVCSRCDGTEKFLVRPGENGLYFRDGDEGSLTETLATLLSDAELRRSYGRESRRIIDEEINTQIHVSNYLKLFSNLTGKSLNV